MVLCNISCCVTVRQVCCCVSATVTIVSWVILLLSPHSEGSNLINVALGKPTKQTDDWYSLGFSQNAVDGDRNSVYTKGSCTATLSDTNTFWIVDLLRTYPILLINITNRSTIEDRLQDFYIYVSDIPYPDPSAPGSFVGQKCLWYPQALPKSGPHSLTCDQVNQGRYVYLWKEKNDIITLCEFEVFVDSEQIQIQDYFSIFPGKKSVKPPFHSVRITTNGGRFNVRNCVVMCFSAPGINNHATIVQLEMATGTCECVEESGLFVPATTIEDSGWTLVKSGGNLDIVMA